MCNTRLIVKKQIVFMFIVRYAERTVVSYLSNINQLKVNVFLSTPCWLIGVLEL